jgi:hypothetical protein
MLRKLPPDATRVITLGRSGDRIECPTLVCDNVAHSKAGQGALRGAEVPKRLRAVHSRVECDGHCEVGT